MTVYSQNGYSANDRSVIASYTVPGSTRKLALRRGDVSVVLLDFASWFHHNIHHIDTGELDDWGYAERPIRGSTSVLSNHASGTAMDLDASAHQLGAYNTFTPLQIDKIEKKLKEYKGVIRWGHDYTKRKDEMHFEINKGAAEVKVQADRIRKRNAAPAKAPTVTKPTQTWPSFPGVMDARKVMNNGYLLKWQIQMKKRGWHLTADGDGGPETARVCVEFRKEKNISPFVPVIDKKTWDAAWTAKT